MSSLLLSAIVAVFGWLGVLQQTAPGSRPAPARPIVVAELFTSEGCSSCPPADALLKQLSESYASRGGVEVIGLEEHVDYWDQLGWKDPFSSSRFTERQTTYNRDVFRSGDIYTPQLVVDGAGQCVGSDAQAVEEALRRAAARPHLGVAIERASLDGDRAAVRVSVEASTDAGAHGAAAVVVAIVEDGLTSMVRSGENQGRTLPHAGVVRALTTAGRLDPAARSWRGNASIELGREWKRPSLRVAAFVQDPRTHQILGAAVSRLTGSGASGD